MKSKTKPPLVERLDRPMTRAEYLTALNPPRRWWAGIRWDRILAVVVGLALVFAILGVSRSKD
jgi:hypothetical protein